MDWETVYGDCKWDDKHLFRYEPDDLGGGAFLFDQDGGRWVLRKCAICGETQKIRNDEGLEVWEIIKRTGAKELA